MLVSEKKYDVRRLVDAFNAGSLLRNPEYQRGEAWSEVQKAGFLDSILRGYPVPALFFYEVLSSGLDDSPTKKYEIVDGQQRLIALKDFIAGVFALQPVSEGSKLRLPKSVRDRPAPWAGKLYGELDMSLRQGLDGTQITVFQIGHGAHVDEVRDLFIRLQSGTALTRQQIRDAWPGDLGPFVERLAGKLNKQPQLTLFSLIDRRGQPSEDENERDQYVTERQVCAQLLRVFLVGRH